MKQLPDGIITPMSENSGYTGVVDNAGQRDIVVLSAGEEGREHNNNFITFGICESLIPQLLSNQRSLSAHGGSTTAMSDQPYSGPHQEGNILETVQASLSTFVGGSIEAMSVCAILPSGSSPASVPSINMDMFKIPTGYGERTTQTVSSVSQSADAITVLSPCIEKSLTDRSLAHRRQQSKASLPRRARGIPGVSSSGDLSKLLTLDEDEELNLSSPVHSEIVVQPPSPSRVSPAMMGRRHSMDSNIGRSRPPTFVRTYREVKWKRVSKPSKLRQLPRTPSAENLIAALSGADDDTESREYITGTHIIRQRVPIFMASREPPDPMGRRFSAGDLIPVTGQGRNWTPSGKCLVIGDVVPSRLVHASSSDDSSSSPSSSTEDVRVSQSSDGSGSESEEHDDHSEFSLIDEDDEDDDDLTAGSEDEENENKQGTRDESMPSDPSTDTSPPSAGQKGKVPKHLDLRRLALVNTLQKKTTVRHPGTASTKESPRSLPHLPSQAQLAQTLEASRTARSMIVSSAAEHSAVPIMSPPNESAVVPSASQTILTDSTTQLAMVSGNTQPTLTAQSLPNLLLNTTSSTGTTTHPPPAVGQARSATSHTPAELDTNYQAVIASTSQTGHPSHVGAISGLDLSLITQPRELPNAHFYSHKDGVGSKPSSPSEMPWVMTSTMIADANVYVSSSHTPNFQMSTRSAHWISPRSVEGTIPINLEDATAIRVETVAVPTSPESEPLHFQKVTYASGFIISSAQWVAPTDAITQPLSSRDVESLPSTAPTDSQSDPVTPTRLSSQIAPVSEQSTGSMQSPQARKSRRKYVVDRTGTIQRPVLYSLDVPVGEKRESSADRSAQRLEVTEKDDYLNDTVTDCDTPSSLDSAKAGASLRQSKRRFHIDKVASDHSDTTEADLCVQLMVSSISQSSSPTKSKRRFVVQRVQDDLLVTSLSNFNGLSPTLAVVSSSTQSTLGSSVDAPRDNPLDITKELESNLRQSLSRQNSESSRPGTPDPESARPVTNRQLSVSRSLDVSLDKLALDLSLEHRSASPCPNEPVVSTTCSELATQLRESCTTVDAADKRVSSGRHTKLRTDTEDDERFAKENDVLLQMILTTISDTTEADNFDNNNGGGSTVAIDNKIEQAMDLVKRHLMYAVREEVEILKQQIGEMMDRITQLEHENNVLRSEAKPETLNKLLQPRLAQPQAALPAQPQTASITAAPTQQQPAAIQIQPPQQQQTTVSQVGQPPSTT